MRALAWVLSAVAIVVVTTAPFEFSADEQIILMKIAHVSPNPLADRAGPVSPVGFGLNILLFVPFGLFGAASRPTRLTDDRWRWIAAVVSLGILLSVAVETAQAFTRYRIPSSADLAANALGALTGAVVAGHRRTLR